MWDRGGRESNVELRGEARNLGGEEAGELEEGGGRGGGGEEVLEAEIVEELRFFLDDVLGDIEGERGREQEREEKDKKLKENHPDTRFERSLLTSTPHPL